MHDVPDYLTKYGPPPPAERIWRDGKWQVTDESRADFNGAILAIVEAEVADRLATCPQGKIVAIGDMNSKVAVTSAGDFYDSDGYDQFDGPALVLECSKLDLQGKTVPLNRKVWLVVQPRTHGENNHAPEPPLAAAPGRSAQGAGQPDE